MRLRAFVATVALVACALAACSEKAERRSGAVGTSAGLVRVRTSGAELEKAWDVLDSLRDELEALDEKQRLTPAETRRKVELLEQVEAAESRFDSAYGANLSALTDLLNEALHARPAGDTTQEALRLYADSAIRNARRFVDHSGNYRRAIELLETARSYYEAVAAVVPDDLTAALERASDYRFLTRARFDQLNRGMSAHDVKALLGVPFEANVRHSEVGGKRVASWLYGREDGAVAALYFDDRGSLYAWRWDARRAD